MKRFAAQSVMLLLAVMIVLPLSAQDEQKKKKNKNKKQQGVVALTRIIDQIKKKVELTDEQAAEMKKLAAEFGPKYQEANRQIAKKRRAINVARKKAVESGKKQKEALEIALKEVNLSDDEKAALKKTQDLVAEFRTSAMKVLTPEQRKKVQPQRQRKNKKKKKKDDSE